MTKAGEILNRARDTMTVGRVFGEPYEQNGVTIIPAAFVRGGGGAGEAEPTEGQQAGSGGGFGMTARPVGAYKIQGEEVTWIPAADTTRVIIFSEVVLLAAILLLRTILRMRQAAG